MFKKIFVTLTFLFCLSGCSSFAAFEAKEPKNPALNSQFCKTNYDWCFNPQTGGGGGD
jgi:uncharacterized protein YceK